ncbi:MAG: ABC transporter permease [Nanoarchaeota archaeon]
MKNVLTEVVLHSWAIAHKELKLKLRYTITYLLEMFVYPAKRLILLLIVYAGFWKAGAVSFDWIDQGNFSIFLILGTMNFILFSTGFQRFERMFRHEKYWETIQGTLISKARSISLALGGAAAGVFDVIAIVIFSLAVSLLLAPIGIIRVLLVLLTLAVMYLGVNGIGLIMGALTLTKENLVFIMSYGFWIWATFSCFYYPISSLPRPLQIFALINPVYHADMLVKEIWINARFAWPSFLYVCIFCGISLVVGSVLFRLLFKNSGIEGY